MHLNLEDLVAFCDGEAGADRSRRIARHLCKCQKCREELRRIRSAKDDLSAGATMPDTNSPRRLAGLLSSIEEWRKSPGAGASELRSRLRWQIEMYLGSPAVSVLERPGMRAEELLGKTSEVLDVLLGVAAAEAVRDDVLSELGSARLETRF